MQTEPLVNSQSEIACHAEAACGGWVNILVSLDPGATLPTKAHPSDVGYDVKALRVEIEDMDEFRHPVTNEAQIELLNVRIRKVFIDTGIHVRPAPGYYCELIPNSRIAKTDFIYANSFGVIDPSYTGTIKVILNAMDGCFHEDLSYFLPGNVVGQLIIRPQLNAYFTQVDNLPETDRGTGGFGSTANNHSTPTT